MPRRGPRGHLRSDLRALRQGLERTFLGRCLRSFVELRGLDRAMILASQSFTALIPLLILVSALLPTGNESAVAASIIRRFDLTGDAARSVEAVFAQSESGSVGPASLLLLLLSAVSLTRRLQQLYLGAYGVPALAGLRGSFNAAMGLAALIIDVGLLYFLRGLVRALPFEWSGGVPLSMLASMVLWTFIPYLLLDRRVLWRRLLPGGLLAGLGVSVYGLASTLFMSRLMTSYSERYGLFGVTVAIVGSLLSVAFILVTATIIAAEFDRAPENWARRLRKRLGNDAPVLARNDIRIDGTNDPYADA